MKQSDIFSMILVAGIGTLAAFLICNQLMGDPSTAKTQFKTINRVITSELAEPDAEIYNSLAINPTVEVYVGDCVDIDQNGILDMAELVACGKEKDPNAEDEENDNDDMVEEDDDEDVDTGDAIEDEL